MTGRVDRAGRALIDIRVRRSLDATVRTLTAWIDTAFTGELVIPRNTIQDLDLAQSWVITAGLADGTQVVLDTFTCFVEWFGDERQIEVVESDGLLPLLGIGLLGKCRLDIDYRLGTVAID